MTKYASAILVAVCAMVGIGAAEAQQSKINSGVRVPTVAGTAATPVDEGRTDEPRPRNQSWCVETGGGLECGETACAEDESTQTSRCDGWITNESDTDFP